MIWSGGQLQLHCLPPPLCAVLVNALKYQHQFPAPGLIEIKAKMTVLQILLILLELLFTSAKGGGYVTAGVCFTICLFCQQKKSLKASQHLLMKFSIWMKLLIMGQRTDDYTLQWWSGFQWDFNKPRGVDRKATYNVRQPSITATYTLLCRGRSWRAF